MTKSPTNPDTLAAAAITWSQQDFGEHWNKEEWPPDEEGYISCHNPECDAAGFDRSRLVAAVTRALESGEVAAGSIRCDGLDKANITPCTNALVYLLEEE